MIREGRGRLVEVEVGQEAIAKIKNRNRFEAKWSTKLEQ